MGLITSTSTERRPTMWTASSRARSRPICLCRRRPSTKRSSTSRPPRRLASRCRRRCSPAPAGVNLLHVPYRGGAPMVTDLVGGQVQVAFDVMVTSLPHIRSGGLRALAVAGSQRFDMLPDVPTIAETLPGFEARTWIGVCAPAGTPVEIINRLNREINAGLATADIRARLSDVGTIPVILSAAEFGAFVAAEAEKWTKVVKFAGIKPE